LLSLIAVPASFTAGKRYFAAEKLALTINSSHPVYYPANEICTHRSDAKLQALKGVLQVTNRKKK